MSSEGVPYACPTCRDDGSPTAQLVFKGQDVPKCRYHEILMVRSRYFDEDGNRILAAPVFKEVDTQ